MQSTTSANLSKLSDAPQTIAFSENNGLSSIELTSSNVVVHTDAGDHNHGSSKVKLKNLVDYNWELRYYTGQLLAVHKGGDYLAYAMKEVKPREYNTTVSQRDERSVKLSTGEKKKYLVDELKEYLDSPLSSQPPTDIEKFPEEILRRPVPCKTMPTAWSGMVRVIHKVTDNRVLLKGMKGEIQDLQFAYIDSEIILASIDEYGNTYVHSIETVQNELRSSLVLEITNNDASSVRHRVTWCPFIDEDDQPDLDRAEDNARLLLTTHYNIARIYKVWGIVSELETSGATEPTVSAETLAAGDSDSFLTITEHSDTIVDAAFSPDGTALATASADGYVIFFQVYMVDEKTPRCLHRWQPHNGKPLSCLFFLDDHKNYTSDVQFWKFAITGAERNEEIKVWCCKSWECRQTIILTPEPSAGLKAVLDAGAQFLMLSHFSRRCLYVLHMKQDSNSNMAYCDQMTEYLLPFQVLSYAVADAATRTMPYSTQSNDYNANAESEDNGSPNAFHHPDDVDSLSEERDTNVEEVDKTLLRLYLLQPKGLQEATMLYEQSARHRAINQEEVDAVPAALSPAAEDINSSAFLQQQSQQLKNILLRARNPSGGLIGQRADSPTCVPTAPQLNLMTPDAFSSPKRDEEDPPITTTPESSTIRVSSPKTVYQLEGALPKYTSGTSSPSREVQEILSVKKDELVDEELTAVVDVDPLSNGYPIADYIDAGKSDVGIAKETIWPSITLAQINEANQRKASSDKSASHSLNQSISNSIVNAADQSNADLSVNEDDNCSEVMQAIQRIDKMSLSGYDRSRLDAIEMKLEKITEMMSEQSRVLRSLCEQRACDPRETIERALQSHTESTVAAIDNAFTQRWSRVEKAAGAAGATAADAVSAGMTRLVDQLTRSLQHEFATRMSATDTRLRDNIDKLVHSKSIQESIGTAVAKNLSGMLRDSFREAMAQTLLPGFEKATAQIFKQVNQTFQTGTKQFAAHAETCARAAAERGGAAAVETLCRELQRHSEALAAAHTQPTHIAPTVHSAVSSVLEQEMRRWREQAASVLEMSRSHTPATPRVSHTPQIMDRQVQLQQITSLMNAGDVNGAFQTALSASDLTLVVHVCRAAEPTRVFSPTCQLKQNVLLSLVQQLAADMTSDTALKHRYLEEAIVNLDPSNPVTREHLPVIVREVKRQLASFLSTHPSHQLARQMKMLLMATESLLAATS